MSANGTRNETKFRGVVAKDGRYSPKLDKATSARLIRYCGIMNVSKAVTAAEAINFYLDNVEREALNAKTKDELIEILLRRYKHG